MLMWTACQPAKKSPLQSDPTITEIFTEAEIHDLETILTFFDGQICNMLNVRSDSILDCYHTFLMNVAGAQRSGVIYIPVQFPAQKAMYARLSPAAFQEIWLRGAGINQETGETSERIALSSNGKFMRLLERLKEDYPLLGAYHKSFSEEHAMTSVMIETFLYNYQLYNMRDVRIRLLVAIHYLTLNDMYERKNAEFQGDGTPGEATQ